MSSARVPSAVCKLNTPSGTPPRASSSTYSSCRQGRAPVYSGRPSPGLFPRVFSKFTQALLNVVFHQPPPPY